MRTRYVGPKQGTGEDTCWAHKGYTREQSMLGPKRVHARTTYDGAKKGARESTVCWALLGYTRGQCRAPKGYTRGRSISGPKKGTREDRVCWAQKGNTWYARTMY